MPKTPNSHPTDLVNLIQMMIMKTLHHLLNNDLFVPGLARFMYTIKLNDTCAGSAVYIIRSYSRVNQLHESRRCVDLSFKTRVWIGCGFIVTLPFVSVWLSFRFSMRLFCCVRMGTSFLKCKGMCEYVLIHLHLPLAREVVAFLACGAS